MRRQARPLPLPRVGNNSDRCIFLDPGRDGAHICLLHCLRHFSTIYGLEECHHERSRVASYCRGVEHTSLSNSIFFTERENSDKGSQSRY